MSDENVNRLRYLLKKMIDNWKINEDILKMSMVPQAVIEPGGYITPMVSHQTSYSVIIAIRYHLSCGNNHNGFH